jgi:hypothetical protein
MGIGYAKASFAKSILMHYNFKTTQCMDKDHKGRVGKHDMS